MPKPVVLVAPSKAQAVYHAMLDELKTVIDPVFKDMELFAVAGPSPTWSLDQEVAALTQTVDQAGLSGFHLVGYSGGAAVSLAFCRSICRSTAEPDLDGATVDWE